MSALKKASNVKIFEGISETIKSYDYYILDVWGVLHDGLGPYDGALDAAAGDGAEEGAV